MEPDDRSSTIEGDRSGAEHQSLSIGELAARTGVSVRSLRYYEQQGLLSPERTSGGQRTYAVEDERCVAQTQQLLRAGFCSSVIRELLLPLESPAGSEELLQDAFAAARARLESERAEIDAELGELAALQDRLGLAPDMHVRSEDGGHDREHELSQAAPFDHRDRRLR